VNSHGSPSLVTDEVRWENLPDRREASPFIRLYRPKGKFVTFFCVEAKIIRSLGKPSILGNHSNKPKQRHLRLAQGPNGRMAADALADIEEAVPLSEEAAFVLAAVVGGNHHRAEEGETDLAAMGVAGHDEMRVLLGEFRELVGSVREDDLEQVRFRWDEIEGDVGLSTPATKKDAPFLSTSTARS